MPDATQAPPVRRFGAFEINPQSGELRKNGMRLRLSGQPFEVLAVLVQRPGEVVTREELHSKLWPADTFVDFDHGLNNAVARIREVLDDSSNTPRYVETIPRRGYRFIAPLADVRPATVAAQADPPAADPSVLSKETRAAESGAARGALASRRQRIQVALAAMTAFVLLAFGLNFRGWRDRLLDRPDPESIRSIAVLPLQNLTGDPAQDYFVDGMHEELISELGSISALHVISRTTMMKYKQTKMSLPEIARELNVDTVLEGSVRRSENQVWITAQLIRAPADRHLWTRTYRRTIQEVPLLQGDVARAISQEIESKVSPQEKAHLTRDRAVDPEAYEAYLRGRSAGSQQKAAAYFETAIEKDPNYAAAFAGLSNSYVRQGADALPGQQAMVLAEAAARKALALDETLAEAHAALGSVKYRYQWDWRGAEAEFRRAIELNPNSAEGHRAYSQYLLVLRRWSEGLSEANRAYALDPLWRGIHTQLAIALHGLRRDDEAVPELEKALEADPQDDGALRLTGWIQLKKGQAREALASYEQGVSVSKRSDHSLAELGYAYGVTGKRAQALQILRELESQSGKRYVSSVYMAFVHMGLGNKEQALASLERAYEEHDGLVVGIYYRPIFEPLYSYPRFHSLLRGMGFPPLPNPPEPL